MSDTLPQTIGIDISKANLDCHAYPAGAARQFTNTAKGHKALIVWLRQWQVERIAYEATATYHRGLEAALSDWPCVKLNLERARRFAQAIVIARGVDAESGQHGRRFLGFERNVISGTDQHRFYSCLEGKGGWVIRPIAPAVTAPALSQGSRPHGTVTG